MPVSTSPLRLVTRVLLCLCLCSTAAHAQDIPVGTWRVHPSSADVRQVERVGNRLYLAGKNSFFQINLTDNSITTLSKVDGLSDNGVSALRYSDTHKALLVGYNSGNLDIIREGKVTNINAIVRFNTTARRAIRQIFINGNLAYLSTDFGLVIVDIVRNEVRGQNTTLGTGSGAQQIPLLATTVFRDSLYVLTTEGLRVASLRANLQNTANYRLLGAGLGLPTTGGASVATFDNQIFVAYPRATTGPGVYMGTTSGFTQLINGAGDFNAFELSGDSLYGLLNSGMFAWGRGNQVNTNFFRPEFRDLQDIVVLATGERYLADEGNGLFQQRGAEFTLRELNGPLTDQAYRLYSHGDRVVMLGGGFEPAALVPSYNNVGFSIYEKGQWRNYSSRLKNFPDVLDITDAYYNEADQNYYLTSYGYGLFVWNETDGVRRVYNDTTSRLPNYASGPNVRMTSVFPGNTPGEVWMTNAAVSSNSVHRMDPNGNISYGTTANGSGVASALRGLTDQFGQKWIVYANASAYPLFVFDEKTGRSRRISSSTGNGGLPGGGVVNDVALDIDGSVWVAMSQGFGVFYSPSSVLQTSTALNITLPIYGGRPVLENDAITCIAIDPAGRKWIGTRDNGLYLFDKDITRIELQFNASNSPLPSDEISDITVNGTTGEVFIATPAGLVSYRSNATFANLECKDVKVFPAPVRPEYASQVTLSNLPAASSVKITDISGKLAYEGTSAGGSFTWNLRDYNGKQVVSGVYLAYIATSDGTLSCVTRLAVVR